MWMWGLIIAGVMFDQLVKFWIVSTVVLGSFRYIAPGVFLTLAFNKGISFSLFSSMQDVGFLVLYGVIFICNCLLIAWLYGLRSAPFSKRFGLMLIIAGGLSNLIDRIFYGAVVDYLTLA